jgi:sulfate adenylyltransferase (ADP) / ATP adenylyltransferase
LQGITIRGSENARLNTVDCQIYMVQSEFRPPEGFLPGTLWERIVDRTQQALAAGALLSMPTVHEVIEQDGVVFWVRMLTNLVRKEAAQQRQDGQRMNPFLPYEPELFVADISATHVCLLNKFNVVDHHILLITRAFAAQESWLTEADFAAMWRCLAEFDGLVFYNGGKLAGASQPHKHLQMIPGDPQEWPIAALFPTAQFVGAIGTIPGLPFVHALTQFDPTWVNDPAAATATLARYQLLLNQVGLSMNGSEPQQTGAYNLLATRHWLLLVPRSQEAFAGIPVNALGFGGTLLVRDESQMQRLKSYGPMTILHNVGKARNRGSAKD